MMSRTNPFCILPHPKLVLSCATEIFIIQCIGAINCFIYPKHFHDFVYLTAFMIAHAVVAAGLFLCSSMVVCIQFAGLINYNIDDFSSLFSVQLVGQCTECVSVWLSAIEERFSENVHLIERKLQRVSAFCVKGCFYVHVSTSSPSSKRSMR